MEFKNNQPSPSARRPEPKVAASEYQSQSPAMQRMSDGGRPMKSMALIAIVAVLIIALLGGFGFMMMGDKGTGMSGVKKNQYQAVFLTNGQVYFGKIEEMNKDRIKLNTIYYLQVQQSVQPEDKKDDSNSQVSLAKLGEELHGPEDSMYISKDQMLFWENLKDGGKVVQAIKGAEKK